MNKNKVAALISSSIILLTIVMLTAFFRGSEALIFELALGFILIGFQFALLIIKPKAKKVMIVILSIIVGILFLAIVINFIIEMITGSVLMIRVSLPGVILFICAAPTLILGYLVVDQYIKKQYLYIIFQTMITLLVIWVGIVDVIMILLGYSSITEVEFDQPDVTLYLVESQVIFNSNHELYLKTSSLYGTKLESDGSWSCDDGCVVRNPEAYTWTWVDDSTLVISSESMYEEVTFYLPE